MRATLDTMTIIVIVKWVTMFQQAPMVIQDRNPRVTNLTMAQKTKNDLSSLRSEIVWGISNKGLLCGVIATVQGILYSVFHD